jgi:hypothetical protein
MLSESGLMLRLKRVAPPMGFAALSRHRLSDMRLNCREG